MARKKLKPRNVTKFPKVAYTDSDWEHVAIGYARWLMKRDGIEAPTGEGVHAKARWSSVYVRNSKGRTVGQRRICAVDWGMTRCAHSNAAYYGGGRWRSGYVDRFEAVFTMPLPNWDWVPEVTEWTAREPAEKERVNAF